MIVFIRVICFFVGLCLAPIVCAEEKLIFAVDIIRHGDRTHIFQLPSSGYEAPEGPGQLTAEGMRQVYELGAQLRTFYIQQQSLLPERYFPASIYVQSTDTDRTLMSAQAFLMGLYPLGTGPLGGLPEAYQPIPIHNIAKHLNLGQLRKESKAVDDFLKKQLTSSEWKEKIKELQPHWAHWGGLIGLKIDRLDQLIFIGDTLKIYQLHHIPLPEKMTDEDANQIIQAGDWIFINIYKYPEVGRSSIRKLLDSVADDFKQVSENKRKYKLISAHETTLISFMSALESPLQKAPPYASYLHMGLFENPEGRYEVKIRFNGEAVKIPACAGSTCSLEQFIHLLKKSH